MNETTISRLRALIVAMGCAAAISLACMPEREAPFKPGNWTLKQYWTFEGWRDHVNQQAWFVEGAWQVESSMDHVAHWNRQISMPASFPDSDGDLPEPVSASR